MTANPNEAQGAAVRFRKEHLLTFRKYQHRRDLVGALLTDGMDYTTAEVDAMLEAFCKEEKKWL